MSLSHIQLEAFREVARTGSFTKAASALGLTQSALSHRIRNLEEHFESTLFVRRGRSIELTELGSSLLRFCRVQTQAEEEFLSGLRPKKSSALSGTLRIGAVSSLMRSAVMPALGGLLRENSSIRIELCVREVKEMPELILSGEADIIVTSGRLALSSLCEERLGFERYVLIESAKRSSPDDVFLDHDRDDRTTYDFFRARRKPVTQLKRSFTDEIYALLDGVAAGWGRAVAPMHLVAVRPDIKMVMSAGVHRTPIYLYQAKQPFYTKLHQSAVLALKDGVRLALSAA